MGGSITLSRRINRKIQIMYILVCFTHNLTQHKYIDARVYGISRFCLSTRILSRIHNSASNLGDIHTDRSICLSRFFAKVTRLPIDLQIWLKNIFKYIYVYVYHRAIYIKCIQSEVCKAIVRDLKELEKVFFPFFCFSEITYNHWWRLIIIDTTAPVARRTATALLWSDLVKSMPSTSRILSPGRRVPWAGPSGFTFVTIIPCDKKIIYSLTYLLIRE